MIIELYGLPGAGKTTTALALQEKKGIELLKIRSKRDLFYYNLLYLIKHPVKFFKTLYYVFVNSKCSLKLFYHKFTNAFLHINAKHQKALQSKNVIIDQGYFQNIISVFEKKIDVNFLNKYCKLFLLPDKLIIFDIDEEIRQRRMTGRGWGARQYYKKEYRENWEKVIKYNNDLLIKNLENVGVDFLLLNENDNEEKIIQNIKKWKENR